MIYNKIFKGKFSLFIINYQKIMYTTINRVSKPNLFKRTMQTQSMQIQPKFVAGYNVNYIVKIDRATTGYLMDHKKTIDIQYFHGSYLHSVSLWEDTKEYEEMNNYLKSIENTNSE